MTPQKRINRYMRAQLEHDAWRRHLPQPAPEPRYLQAALNALAVLVLAGGLAYLLADSWSTADLRDGLVLLWEAL